MLKEKAIKVSGKLMEKFVKKEETKWPPHCVGIFHQPKHKSIKNRENYADCNSSCRYIALTDFFYNYDKSHKRNSARQNVFARKFFDVNKCFVSYRYYKERVNE